MKLYSGRIPADPSPLMDQINKSLPFDIRLLPYDIATNKAWATQLHALGVFTAEELENIHAALGDILVDFEAGAFEPIPDDEDVHTLVERCLTEKLGPTGAKIHTGRSRNDQVVCDVRLFAMARLDDLDEALRDTIGILGERAAEHAETLLAGTTHMQPALPITLGHYLLSCATALLRDLGRMRDARKRTSLCPLGAGAMAGSGFEVDRHALAKDMGFSGVLPNSVDAISDRDFCLEIANACATMLVHLSRYADQMIVWANPAFGYIRFADQWSTGSSMMPQKRNPDAMELVRGKAARAIGASLTLQTLLKGLPLSYAKDLQEDKEPLFDTMDQSLLTLRVFAQAVKTATFNKDRMLAVLTSDMLATDLADHLARTGVPFRKAHERVGALVSDLEATNRDLLSLEQAEILERFPELGPEPPVLSFAQGVAMRTVSGGTAPERVREQIANLPKLIAEA